MALFKNKKMSAADKIGLAALVLLAAVLVGILFLYGTNFQVLNPKGPIAERQRDLIILASALSLIVVLPVFALTFGIAWKYRAGNTKAKYMPDWDGNRILETIWWGVPLVLITILSVIIYRSSHELDPFKPLAANNPPVTVQVVALQWKWLFLYPEHGIATVNYVQFPEDTPVNFVITADAPMNSFWIPQLGGQIYAMAGMSTKLHLMANEPGEYRGSSANISGQGFEGMKFIARATSQANFDEWVQSAKNSGGMLTMDEYHKLAVPSQNVNPIHYSDFEPNLYGSITVQYMAPGHSMPSMKHGGH